MSLISQDLYRISDLFPPKNWGICVEFHWGERSFKLPAQGSENELFRVQEEAEESAEVEEYHLQAGCSSSGGSLRQRQRYPMV
jgi:hypothetical protein